MLHEAPNATAKEADGIVASAVERNHLSTQDAKKTVGQWDICHARYYEA